MVASPEQRLITMIRGNVVDLGCSLHSAAGLKHHLEWMLAQELSSGLLPLVAIAALGSRLVARAPTAGLHRGHVPCVQV